MFILAGKTWTGQPELNVQNENASGGYILKKFIFEHKLNNS